VTGLWFVGVALAGFTAPLAWRRTGVVSALPFVAVALSGVVLAVAVLRANRAALAISTFLLGAQLFGVVGSAWELIHHVKGSKARELRRLGVDPTLGVALNLLYSAVASVVFAWVAARWWAARRRPIEGGTG
jgi:ABC-type branched-subunit amino acid transport system permease subunit